MKSIKTIGCIILTLLLCLSGCGSSASNGETSSPETENTTESQFDLDEYKESVSACTEEISDAAVALYNVVKKEAEYLKLYNNISGKSDVEGAVKTAMKWLEEKSDYSEATIEEQYRKITRMYKNIISVKIDGAEAEEIKETFDNLFTAYIGIYNYATDPSGSTSTFVGNCNDCIDTIKTTASKLDVLLS